MIMNRMIEKVYESQFTVKEEFYVRDRKGLSYSI